MKQRPRRCPSPGREHDGRQQTRMTACVTVAVLARAWRHRLFRMLAMRDSLHLLEAFPLLIVAFNPCAVWVGALTVLVTP